MPFAELMTPTGRVRMHYVIATPEDPYSTCIDTSLPCVLFLHSVWSSVNVFETQFNDPLLRSRFNLIGIDLRSFGLTEGLIKNHVYGLPDSADDVYRFLEAIHLPPVHVFAVSLGTCIALELSSAHPERILSLTFCSPAPLEEPIDAQEGRLELYNVWMEAYKDGDGDPALLEHAETGALQLMVNNVKSSIGLALYKECVDSTVARKKERAMSDAEANEVEEDYNAMIGWYLHRPPMSFDALNKVKSPISMIHCAEDVAYYLEKCEQLKETLEAAGIASVELHEVPGPHFGNVSNPEDINRLLFDHVMRYVSPRDRNGRDLALDSSTEKQKRMITPFTKLLVEKYGYNPEDDEDDDDEDFFITTGFF